MAIVEKQRTDLLWLDGIGLTREPLHRRKEILKKMVPDGGLIRYSDLIDEYGIRFFEAAKSGQLDGVIANKRNSVYHQAIVLRIGIE